MFGHINIRYIYHNIPYVLQQSLKFHVWSTQRREEKCYFQAVLPLTTPSLEWQRP